MIRLKINDETDTIYLRKDWYKIDLLGGYQVSMGNFEMELVDVSTGDTIKLEKAKWPVQTRKFGKRAKRVFTIDIMNESEYQIRFRNIDSLRVKKINLPIFSLLFGEVPKENLEVVFYN